jgi:hypothetical protein
MLHFLRLILGALVNGAMAVSRPFSVLRT